MSLISEALKKAQRMRTSDPASGPSPEGGGGSMGRRDRALPAQSLVWIITGAAVIICAAIVTTVLLVRPAPSPLSAAKAAAAPPAANTSGAPPAPVIFTPVAVVPVVASSPKPLEPASIQAEPPGPAGGEAVVPPPKSPESSSVASPLPASPRVPPSVAVAAGADAARPDPRIQAFVDTIKVAGIRSSGTDSKVLMNDRVYRVNDIVDLSLNLRLIGVQADSLTFVDENNVVYRKNF